MFITSTAYRGDFGDSDAGPYLTANAICNAVGQSIRASAKFVGYIWTNQTIPPRATVVPVPGGVASSHGRRHR